MTREEEIRQKAISEQRELMESWDWRAGFIAGAKWADKTMIEKARNWLENNINDYIIIDDYLGKIQLKISSSMFDNFKKANGYFSTISVLCTPISTQKNMYFSV